MVIGWVLGATLTIAVPLTAGLPPPISWIFTGFPLIGSLISLLVVVLLLYLFVSLATTNGQPSTMNLFGQFCFGMVIGLNAGANFMLVFAALYFIFWLGGAPVAPFLAGGLSLINALAAVPALGAAPWFAAVLGWASWAMPMSWPSTALGLLFFVIDVGFALFGVRFSPHFEWWTGTVILHGGVFYIGRNGYNLGNFSFFHPDFSNTQPWFSADTTPPLLNSGTVQGLTFHETGHTLTVAACGSVFHLIGGFIDQSLFTGAFALNEQLAEGHLHSPVDPWIDWWRPQIAPLGGGVADRSPDTANNVILAPTVVALGTTITLDRTDTAVVPQPATDPDSYPQGSVNPGVVPSVDFLWTIGQQPAGSVASLATPGAASVSLTPDVGGDYVIRLHYTDGVIGTAGIAPQIGPLSPGANFIVPNPAAFFESDPVSVVEARIGGGVSTTPNVGVQLSSTGSTAGTVTIIAFFWEVIGGPAGSTATIAPPDAPNPTFTADTVGVYIIRLTVTVNVNLVDTTHSTTGTVEVRPT
jgi:hypothetical protein